MIITCPHCQTKYQVTFEAIGSAGRKVQCAHCHQAWNQGAQPDAPETPADIEANKLFDAMAEDALDEAMSAEEKTVAAKRPAVSSPPLNGLAEGIDPAELKKRQQEFSRRQNAMISRLPLARLRRGARIAGVVLLAGIVGGAYFWRVPIVERYPDLAGLYESIGLGVNVVGLDFADLETLKALSGGNDVLTVSAQIVGQSGSPVAVPPVVVSLLDETGHAVYEWSVSPRVRDLMAGERATFDTRLSLPPSEAVRVRLSFAGQSGIAGGRGNGSQQTVQGQAAPVPETHAAPTAETQAAPAASGQH
ncbi:MAG: DUF3426 domain-containing protein [Devosia sp.]